MLVYVLLIRNLAQDLLWRLNVPDLIELSLSCKALHRLLQDDSLWHEMLERRHGITQTPRGSYRDEFCMRTSLKKQATRHLQGPWSRDTRHWSPSTLSPERCVMLLDHVWWMEVGIVFWNVMPGFYKVQWSVIGVNKQFPFFVKALRHPFKQTLTPEERTRRVETYASRESDLNIVRYDLMCKDTWTVYELPCVFHLKHQDDIVTGVYDASSTYKWGQGLEYAQLIPCNKPITDTRIWEQGDVEELSLSAKQYWKLIWPPPGA
eukprot:Blabericola_migrator_1__7846@NODE_400_length_8905_cov_313_446821_g317_i0_p5_GENE_NODE_400_length_8905_cov_313_446821_g317_i0NODE_400_length_8905_cov_313_446821_g317_i0_p5_ORF_typecomplete_len263_score53_22PP2/PF14299_6/0_0072Fboxlike/PF12937_7/0_078Fbox/PF00646_33/0_14_NODE_400_length_8905_cov_313_446821_g317_i058656653